MIYDSAIYGGQDDPQIIYMDRTVEVPVYVGGGGGGGFIDEEYAGNHSQEVEKIIYKDPVFPKFKIRIIESQNIDVKITVNRISVKDI